MKCPTPYKLKEPSPTGLAQLVPCGQCGACRANKRAQWSFRLQQELKYSESCVFITLTYDDINLPHALEPTLVKTDLQKWLKRLRKEQSHHTEAKIRYYAVGEYGTNTKRPHYHALVFNADLETLRQIEKTWKFGHIKVDPVGDASIHYITKYHVNYDKKSRKDIKQPEFALMSRKPAIGAKYIDINKKYHQNSKHDYVVNNGFKQSLPRYYREKIFTEKQRNELNETKTKENSEINWEELQRLQKIGYKNPYQEYKKRLQWHADQVKDKQGKENLF